MRRLAAALLVVLAAAASGAPALAQTAPTHCTSDPKELWCATLTMGTFGNRVGFVAGSYGSVAPATFDWRTAKIAVRQLYYSTTNGTVSSLRFFIARASGTTPRDGLLGLYSYALEIGTGTGKKSFSIDTPGRTTGFSFADHDLSWSENDDVPVKLIRANTPPTSANRTVTATQDTEYRFSTSDFDFSDLDGDRLGGVKIVSVPAMGKGVLMRGSTTLGAGDSVSRAELRAGRLKYVPPSGETGTGFASFTFKVSDGERESTATYTMTVNVAAASVTAHCDPSDPREIWCSTLTVGRNPVSIDDLGYEKSSHGSLTLDRFTRQAVTIKVTLLEYASNGVTFAIAHASGPTPPDGLLGDGIHFLEIGAEGGKRSFLLTQIRENSYRVRGLAFSWSVNETVPVRLLRGNGAPTATDGAVTTAQDTWYRFRETDFGFRDADGQALSSVKIVSLPEAGALKIGQFNNIQQGETRVTDVGLGDRVTQTDIKGGRLVYVPPTGRHGAGLGSFAFRVNDGFDDSAANYTMTVNVTRRAGSGMSTPTHCNPSDPIELWCATLTVGTSGNRVGLVAGSYGSVAPATFDWRTAKIAVRQLYYSTTNGTVSSLRFFIARSSGTRPRDGLLGARRFALEIGTGAGKKSLPIDAPEFSVAFNLPTTGLSWSQNDTVPVKLLHANTPPTATDGAVTTARDADYRFEALDFGFRDADGQELSSVNIVALPGAGKLTLGGTNLPAGATVTRTQLDAGNLGYDPPAGRHGTGLASFSFKVNDGHADSDSSYTMTVHVTPPFNAAPDGHCNPLDTRELWCATMTVGARATQTGFGSPNTGSLTQGTFDWRTNTLNVHDLIYYGSQGDLVFFVELSSGTTPADGLLGPGDFSLEIGTGAGRKSFPFTPGTARVSRFSPDRLFWSVGDKVPVKLLRVQAHAPTAPTAPELDAPPATVGFLRARWQAPEDPGNGIRGYHVHYRRTDSQGGVTWAVGADAREHILGRLDPGATYEVKVRAVYTTDERLAFADPTQRGPWSSGTLIRLPAAGTAPPNDITVSLEFPPGAPPVLASLSQKLVHRLRVSGLYDISGLGPKQSGIATVKLVLRPSSGAPAFYWSYGLGIPYKFIVWDGPGTGYWERAYPVGNDFFLNHGPLSLEITPSDTMPSNSPWLNTRIGTPSRLCVETSGGSPCPPPGSSDQQVEVDPPTVQDTPGVAGAGSDGTWGVGDTVEVTLTFSERVEVDESRGTPSVGVELGGVSAAARQAAYVRGSGTAALTFGYTLIQGDGSHTRMGVTPNSLALNGGTIRSVESQADALLEHEGTLRQGRTSRSDGPDVRFDGVPNSHDGETAFKVSVQFGGEPSGLSAKRDAASVLEVTGGSVATAREMGKDANTAWEVTVAPDGAGDVTVRLPARACNEAYAVCIGGRALSEAVEATVPGPPLTAAFTQAPAAHDGTSAFMLHFEFSHEPKDFSYRTVRDALFDVEGGRIEKARRLEGGRDLRWEITVVPDGAAAVTLAARATTDCAAQHAACDAEGRKFAGALSLTVPGPATLAVADATVKEAEGSALDFVVTLSHSLSVPVTVGYVTADGTAEAGSDYSETSGTLTFAVGQTQKTVSVPVSADQVDEESETLTLTLSSQNPSGVRLADAEATGTIENTDPQPGGTTEAPTARFANLPANHDGASAFTVELHFSAAPAELTATTVAGGLLEVAGGTVTSAQQKTSGDSRGWEVTVTPSQVDDIEIRLPARACGETNAVCVGGRALADAATATVRVTLWPPHRRRSSHHSSGVRRGPNAARLCHKLLALAPMRQSRPCGRQTQH